MKKFVGVICLLLGVIWFSIAVYSCIEAIRIISNNALLHYLLLSSNVSTFPISLMLPLILIVISSIAIGDNKKIKNIESK